jgi:hypothetical protein
MKSVKSDLPVIVCQCWYELYYNKSTKKFMHHGCDCPLYTPLERKWINDYYSISIMDENRWYIKKKIEGSNDWHTVDFFSNDCHITNLIKK